MPARPRPRVRLVATALTTAVLLTTGAATAVAAPGSSVAAATDVPALCSRADTLEARLEAALERIRGGADQRGSVAWLRARAQRATAEDRPDLAESLHARADRRERRVPEIEDVLARLARVTAEHCPASATAAP